MKTDRELLELAAKAAGIDYEWDGNGRNMLRAVPFREYTNYEHWNPLTDDGDALRLAVKLGMDVQHFQITERVEAWVHGWNEVAEDYGTDPYAATRRAIVRAAAAIGEVL